MADRTAGRIYASTVLGPRGALGCAIPVAFLSWFLNEAPAMIFRYTAGWGCLGLAIGIIFGAFLPIHRMPARPLRHAAFRSGTWLTVLWLIARISPYAEHEPLRFMWLSAIFVMGGILTTELTVPLLLKRRSASRWPSPRPGWFPLIGPSLFVACAASTVGCPRQFIIVDDPPTQSPVRVALIGLDGADQQLLDLASRMGRTPHVDQLRRTGVWGDLTPEVAFSPPSWTTIATGLPAAEHGVDGFLQRRYEDGRLGPENPGDIGHRVDRLARRFFDYSSQQHGWLSRPSAWLSRHIGLPALEYAIPSLREPFDWVATDAHGVQKARVWEIAAAQGRSACVVRWLFTDPAPQMPDLQVLSGWQPGWRTPVGASSPDLLSLARTLSTTPETTAEEHGLDHYLETASQEVDEGRSIARALAPDTDLYAHVFYFPDGLGHRLAHSVANGIASADPDSGALRFLSLLGEVDELVGELVNQGFSVVIVSDHGMEPVPSNLAVPIVSQVLGVDWEQLLAATGLTGSRGPWFRPSSRSGLRLEPTALAPPGALERAATILEDLQDTSGARLFGSVAIRQGALELGQPLRVEVSELGTHRLASPDLGSLDRFVHHRGIEGIHGRPLPGLDREMGHDGILIAKGPGLSGGRHVEGLRNQDIAPLLLHWLELPLEPGHNPDGLELLFDPAYLVTHAPAWRQAPSQLPYYSVADGPSSDESFQELRSLGYLN